MRHRKTGRKFGRKLGDKKAFLKGLLHNLIMKEKITTTQARAKELKRLFDPLVTLAKKQTLASYRLLLTKLPKKSAEKIFKDIGLRYKDRKSGYTRIVKLNPRMRDAAPMAMISLVEEKPKVDLKKPTN
ncbi:MAG: 50S ribosomal protein L17 [Patescibacteria group bacterium]